MQTYTFIADYDGGTYIAQSGGLSTRAALQAWLLSFDFSVIPRRSAQDVATLRRDLSADIPTPIDSVRNVWCISAGHGFLVHIIKTEVT